ncbi:hypothetical protein D3C75_1160900 [compost metagenome]
MQTHVIRDQFLRRIPVEPVPQTVDGFGQSVLGNRLQEIIKRVNIEGLQRIIPMCRNENNIRSRAYLLDQLSCPQTVHIRHMDVQKNHIRLDG